MLDSFLLAAAIPLGPAQSVAVVQLVPEGAAPAASLPDVLDSARRHLASSKDIQDALLPSVQLGQRPALYVFSIISAAQSHAAVTEMNALHFGGLRAPTPAFCFPFQKINEQPRHILSHFLGALRTRLIERIVISNTGVQRCKGGFLISHQQLTPGTDWGSGWEYKALSRPLIFCHIQLQPTTSAILIRPSIVPTPYLPLHSSLPLPRSPILLLPYGTPAYFLTTYSGPTSALQHQFADSLKGHGQPSLDSSFIIGWISVENKRGEDKGITFVYPTRLCLMFVPALNRSLLDYTPDLPGPLQLSPKLLSISTPKSECPPIVCLHRPSLFGSPATELEAFRALTLSKYKNIQSVAAQASSYVDHVAKDRERERERLKREREGHSPGLITRTTPSMSSNVTPSNISIAPPLTIHTPTPTPSNMPTQNFYPSPPQADITAVPITGSTSPVLPVAPRPTSSQPPLSSAGSSRGPPISSSSYDPFEYLMSDVGMDFGVDFGMSSMDMNLGENSESRTGSAGPGSRSAVYNDDTPHGMNLGVSSGMEFDDFTDDDFSFFDRPSVNTVPAPPPPQQQPPPIVNPIPNPLQVTPPPSFEDAYLSGPEPPSATPHSQSLLSSHSGGPWSSIFPDGFTPRSVEYMDSANPSEKISSTPGGGPKTPFSDGVPTSNVHLEHDVRQRHVSSDKSAGLFDPIPFAKSHRVSDGKYAPMGKFGLPSPPPDEPKFPALPSVKSRIAVRKRSLPSGVLCFLSLQNIHAEGWRPRYDAITDPRVGVMKKLIGVKRRLTLQTARNGRNVRILPRGIGEQGEWGVHQSSLVCSIKGSKDVEFEHSEDEVSQSEDDDSDMNEGEDGEDKEEETPATSRPNTPPPSYLPLGPTLLHTQFNHTHLLPLSKPLRSQGSTIGNGGGVGVGSSGGGVHGVGAGGNIVVNVPTPVSPAAGLGLTVEKWRALEVVVNVLAKEAVENVVWRDTWVANNIFETSPNFNGEEKRRIMDESGGGGGGGGGVISGAGGKKLTEVWASDVKSVEKVLAGLEGVKTGLGVNDVFGLASSSSNSLSTTKSQAIQVLMPPKFSVGKGDVIIAVLPPALRFWEKLGLGPKSGEKDGTVFVLFADDGEQHRQVEVANWLAGVCNAYETKHLGKLKLGTNTFCIKDGLVPLRFDTSFKKTFVSFTNGLTGVSTPILLFLVVPITLMTLSSPVFRQILSTVQKALKTLPENQVVLRLIPEHAINYIEADPSNTNQLESFCINLYNRILVPVTQPLARVFRPDNTPLVVKAYLQKPIFTIARPVYNRVTYVRSIHASLDILDRWTLLHVGYRMSSCGKWVMVACVDQRGEVWDQGVWLVKSVSEQQDGDGESTTTGICTGGVGVGISASGGLSGIPSVGASHEEMLALKKVWEFAVGFARRADVEWRIVISKLGVMDETELTAWTSLLPVVIPTSGLAAVHVSLMCADPDSPWLFTKLNSDVAISYQPSPDSIPTPNAKATIFSDASSTTYALYPNIILPIATPPTHSDIGLSLPYVADPSSGSSGMGDGDSEISTAAVSAGTNVLSTFPVSPTESPMNLATGSTMPHPVGLVPRSTTCLVRVPRSAPTTSISMLHIHVLATYCYPATFARKSGKSGGDGHTMTLELKTVHMDVTKNFYELSVLAQAMWSMGVESGCGAGSGGGISGNPILPMHLAIVDIMGRVTDGANGVGIDS